MAKVWPTLAAALPGPFRRSRAFPADARVGALTHRYWVNFARTGHSDEAGVPVWPAVELADTMVLTINADGAHYGGDGLATRLISPKRMHPAANKLLVRRGS